MCSYRTGLVCVQLISNLIYAYPNHLANEKPLPLSMEDIVILILNILCYINYCFNIGSRFVTSQKTSRGKEKSSSYDRKTVLLYCVSIYK